MEKVDESDIAQAILNSIGSDALESVGFTIKSYVNGKYKSLVLPTLTGGYKMEYDGGDHFKKKITVSNHNRSSYIFMTIDRIYQENPKVEIYNRIRISKNGELVDVLTNEIVGYYNSENEAAVQNWLDNPINKLAIATVSDNLFEVMSADLNGIIISTAQIIGFPIYLTMLIL